MSAQGANWTLSKPKRGEGLIQKESKFHPDTESKIHSYKESIHKEKSKNALPQEFQSKKTLDYLCALKPQRKKESETSNLRALLNDYCPDEIELALDYLLKFGVPRSGERCHSPMGYLAFAITEVLQEAKERADKIKKRQENELTLAALRADNACSEERQAALELAQEQKFIRTFPNSDDQAEMVQKFVQRYPLVKFPDAVLRRLAITAWISGEIKK